MGYRELWVGFWLKFLHQIFSKLLWSQIYKQNGQYSFVEYRHGERVIKKDVYWWLQT